MILMSIQVFPVVWKKFGRLAVVCNLDKPIQSGICNVNKFVSSLDIDKFLQHNTLVMGNL